MKNPARLLSLIYLATALHVSAAHYHIYLLGGQSNGNGRAEAAQLTAPLDAAQTDVRFYWHRTQAADNVGHLLEDQWIDLAPGSGHGTGAPVYAKEFGSEVSFGRAMAEAKPSENIAIIKYTHGGTNLHTQWSATGTQYTTFVSTVRAALTAVTTAGHTYELRGMLWVQGESDTSGSAADNYQTNLTNLIARVRTDLNGGVAFPFVLSTLSNSQHTNLSAVGSGPYKVRQAQEAVAAADPTVGIVITDGYSVRSDVIHFDHNAQIALGQAFTTQMLAFEGTDETAPQLSSTTPADGVLTTPVDSNLVATFSEPIALKNGGTVTLRDLGPGADVVITLPDARVSASGNQLVIDPATDLVAGNPYAVQISATAVEDLAGNAFAGIGDDTTWSFTTANELVAENAGTTGVFDENADATNELDIELPASTLGAFKTSVLAAYNQNLGGVIDWETGLTATPSAGSAAGNSLTRVAVEYGMGGGKMVMLTFDRPMDLYTNDINSQIQVLSRQGSWHNALIPGGGNEPVGLAYTVAFAGADLVELGMAVPSRSTYGALGVDFRATANYSGGGSGVINFTVVGTAGTSDTFLHFTAPASQAITSVSVEYVDDNGQSLTNGQRRPVLDDLGFVVAAPPNTFATWIANPAFGLIAEDRDFPDDPDGDGLTNGLEAWFGTHPGEFSAGLAQVATDGTTTTFTHPQNKVPPSDLTGYYEWSPNLVDWYAGDGSDGPIGGPTVAIVPNAVGAPTTVTATASEALNRIFLRAAVNQN